MPTRHVIFDYFMNLFQNNTAQTSTSTTLTTNTVGGMTNVLPPISTFLTPLPSSSMGASAFATQPNTTTVSASTFIGSTSSTSQVGSINVSDFMSIPSSAGTRTNTFQFNSTQASTPTTTTVTSTQCTTQSAATLPSTAPFLSSSFASGHTVPTLFSFVSPRDVDTYIKTLSTLERLESFSVHNILCYCCLHFYPNIHTPPERKVKAKIWRELDSMTYTLNNHIRCSCCWRYQLMKK